MLYHKVTLIAKINPLKYFLSRSTLIGRLEKWVIILNEFDIKYVDQKSIKGQAIEDQLAYAPILVEQQIHVELLDVEIMQISTQT